MQPAPTPSRRFLLPLLLITPFLAFAQSSGSLEIKTVPEKAMVQIDGKKQGLTPITLKDLEPGEHLLVIHKDGYQDSQQTITVQAGENPSIGVELTRLTKVNIKSKPKGATLYLGSELMGTTPYSGDLPTGNHTLNLKLLGYADWEQEVIIVDGYRTKVELQKLYQVQFSSDPTGAEIFMDNKYLADTPHTGNYPEGKHLIRMHLEGYEDYEKQVRIKKDLTLDADLKSMKKGGGFLKKTLLVAVLAGGGYYYYTNYVDTPQDAGFPTPPSRP